MIVFYITQLFDYVLSTLSHDLHVFSLSKSSTVFPYLITHLLVNSTIVQFLKLRILHIVVLEIE